VDEFGADEVLYIGEATDSRFGFAIGQTVLRNVHRPQVCAGRHCVIHNPSQHHMVDWPTLWRGDRQLMERVCPHGIGHPDPDDAAWHRSQGRDWAGVHSCDRCCRPPA
jgi:hypothetical protein